MSEPAIETRLEAAQGARVLFIGNRIPRLPIAVVAPWTILIILFIVYAVLQPNVLALNALGNIGIGALVLSIVAAGQTIVILTAGIDLSVGGMMSFGSAVMATQMHDRSVVEWVIGILVIGAGIGAVNGAIISIAGMQPFIVTLATWSILNGAALLVLPSAGGIVPSQFSAFIYGNLLGLPSSLVLLLALATLWLWLKRTRVMRRAYALGSDEESAFLSGVPIKQTKIAVYALSGLMAMGAAIVYTMQTSSGDPVAGDGFILPSVAAVVIGGTSLFGGRGGVGGTIAGALVLVLIADVMFALGVSQFWVPLVQGSMLIFAVVVGVVGMRRARRLEGGL